MVFAFRLLYQAFFPDRPIRAIWLALFAFALQYIVLRQMDDPLPAKMVLGLSHALLIGVIALNWRYIGLLVVGLGLFLNLIVIYSNGGLMPMSPQAAIDLGLPGAGPTLPLGSKFGAKSVVLNPSDTRFYVLSDRLPTRFPRPLLASVGDIVALAGLGILGVSVVAGVFQGKAGEQSGRRSGKRGFAPFKGPVNRLSLSIRVAYARRQQAYFLQEWRTHWQGLSAAIRLYVENQRPEAAAIAQQEFDKERAWLAANKWKFTDLWGAYTAWDRPRPVTAWGPLDPREVLVRAPLDPYANVYERWDIPSVLEKGQVRSDQDYPSLFQALSLLEGELKSMEDRLQGKARASLPQSL